MGRRRHVFLSLNLWIVGSVSLVVLFWIVSIVVGFVWYPAVGGELSAEPTKSRLASSGTADKPVGAARGGGSGVAMASFENPLVPFAFTAATVK